MTALKPRRILVAYDFSSRCREAWACAQDLAKRCGATVEAAHVRAWLRPDGAALSGALAGATRRQLQAELVRRLPGLSACACHVVEGPVAPKLLTLIRERKADLLVLASEGAGAARRLARGSAAEALVGQSPVPVLTVFERARAETRSMLAPIDGERCSPAGLERIARAARSLGARLTFIHIGADRAAVASAKRRLERAAAALPAELREAVQARLKFAVGEAASRVAEESGKHGLLAVLAGRGARADAALGAMAADILRLSRAPLLAVPELTPSLP